MSQQSPIFARTERFMLWLLPHTAKFPKHERFRLARRIDDAVFAFHERLLTAVRSNRPGYHLQQADLELSKLRVYLRLAVEMKYTSVRQYQHATEHTTELGRLLGGWLKTA